MSTKTLILGAKGMLGTEIAKEFPDALCYDIENLDITNKEAVDKKISELAPHLVINCAAYTDVEGAESAPDLCNKVNADAAGYLASACNKNKSTLVHISTDFVFDGKKETPYTEVDGKNPLSIYGKSKSKGEEQIQSNTEAYYIVRTAWIYGKAGKNFVDTIARLAQTKEELQVVDDQKGNPTNTKDLAQGIKKLIKEDYPFGIYHLVNEGIASRYELAQEIITLLGLDVKVTPIKSETLQMKAARPENSALHNTKGPKLREWKEALKEHLTLQR